MSNKVEAVNMKFWLSLTKGLLDIMNEYQGKIDSVKPEEEARLKDKLIKIVQKLEANKTLENDNPMMTHYLTKDDVDAYHAFAFQALCDDCPILEPYWDKFGYELYDLWQSYYLLFEDRKELVDPEELELK